MKIMLLLTRIVTYAFCFRCSFSSPTLDDVSTPDGVTIKIENIGKRKPKIASDNEIAIKNGKVSKSDVKKSKVAPSFTSAMEFLWSVGSELRNNLPQCGVPQVENQNAVELGNGANNLENGDEVTDEMAAQKFSTEQHNEHVSRGVDFGSGDMQKSHHLAAGPPTEFSASQQGQQELISDGMRVTNQMPQQTLAKQTSDGKPSAAKSARQIRQGIWRMRAMERAFNLIADKKASFEIDDSSESLSRMVSGGSARLSHSDSRTSNGVSVSRTDSVLSSSSGKSVLLDGQVRTRAGAKYFADGGWDHQQQVSSNSYFS